MWAWVTETASRTRHLLSQHKKKVAAVSVVLGGVYLYRKLRPLIDDVRSSLKLLEVMEKQSKGDKTQQLQQLRQRFDHNMRVANYILHVFAQTALRRELGGMFDVAGIRDSLRVRGRGHNMDLWHQFKVQAFARTIAAVYNVCLMNTLVHIQLSIVARYMVVDASQQGFPGSPPPPDTTEANKSFLNIAEHAQTVGLRHLASQILAVVTKVTARWDLRTQCSYEEVLLLLNEIRNEFEQGEHVAAQTVGGSNMSGTPNEEEKVFAVPEHHLLDNRVPYFKYIFPPQGAGVDEKAIAPNARTAVPTGDTDNSYVPYTNPVKLAEMVEETKNILLTGSFQTVVKASLDVAFALLAQELKAPFRTDGVAAAPANAPAAPAPAAAAAPGDSASAPAAAAAGASEPTAVPAAAPSSQQLIAEKPTLVPFPNVIVRMAKLFDMFFPEGQSANFEPPSALFAAVENLSDLSRLCTIIFFPMGEVPSASDPAQPGSLNGVLPADVGAVPVSAPLLQHTASLGDIPLPASRSASVEVLGGGGGGGGAGQAAAPTSAAGSSLVTAVQGLPSYTPL